MNPCILTINGGSSSIKFALFESGPSPVRLVAGKIDRIGLADAVLTIAGSNQEEQRRPIEAATRHAAVTALLQLLQEQFNFDVLAAVGHRVVHGGPHYHKPQALTKEMLAELRRISPFVPEHLPSQIELIEAFQTLCPGVPQVACFDTAFHAGLPRVAQLLPIPRRLDSQGVRRYGFHGLSYSFLMEELARVAGIEAARGRVILAHLGNGASMAAVHGGRSIDTTMAFTPTAGLPMSTRSGDLDPGLVWYLARTENLTPEQFHELVNRRSGLLGVSETSSDMRDLVARRNTDQRAAEAIDLFCYQAKKWIGAFAAALGGLDTLVFTGGIGENAPEVRSQICQGLEFLGIRINPNCNLSNAPVISPERSRASVRVIRTDEEVMIARSVISFLTV